MSEQRKAWVRGPHEVLDAIAKHLIRWGHEHGRKAPFFGIIEAIKLGGGKPGAGPHEIEDYKEELVLYLVAGITRDVAEEMVPEAMNAARLAAEVDPAAELAIRYEMSSRVPDED